MSRLPPFDALIAFDAAVRYGSMTLAAAELGLTQSAVSHRVRRLETFMGATLLQRHNVGLLPTPAGEAILEGLTKLIDDAGALRARCQFAAAPGRLRVGIGAALADNWLVRRLPEFISLNPHSSVELVVIENQTPELMADLDVRILWVPGSELRATSTQQPLFQERVFPVCHPGLLPPNFVVGDASVLTTLPLLHKGAAGRGTSAEWSWPAWFDRLGLHPRAKEGIRFASIGPAIAAAHEGAGVVLARSMLVDDALKEGRLVRIFAPHEDMPSSKAHVVSWPSRLRNNERVKAFTSWLVKKAQETLVGSEQVIEALR
jgi:LysR family transcriptional regulator, glycine cleavage system transcriptional activator